MRGVQEEDVYGLMSGRTRFVNIFYGNVGDVSFLCGDFYRLR